MANSLWAAFVADNGSNQILMASSQDGSTWTPSVFINQWSPFTPSLAYFNGRLYVAFITDDEDSATGVPSNRIFLSSTSDGVSWSVATVSGLHSPSAPSLAVWNNHLHIAFIANDGTNEVLVYSSPDGKTWSNTGATGQTSQNAPSIRAFAPSAGAGDLYLAFVAENGSNDIFVCSLAVGGAWQGPVVTGQSCSFSPSLVTFGSTLQVVFASNDTSQRLLVSSLEESGGWSGAAVVNQTTSASPGAAFFNGDLRVGFVAASGSGELLMTASASATTWPTTDSDLKQQSAVGPSFASAPFACSWQLVGDTHRKLRGNSNYFLWNGKTPTEGPNVLGLSIQVVIGNDMVCTPATYPKTGASRPEGFDIQLNCYPPAGDTSSSWQQYVFSFQPAYTHDNTIAPIPAVSCSVEFFGSSSFNAHLPQYLPVTTGATPQALPAGYNFTITLTNDGSGNVTSAKFDVVADNGATQSQTFPIGPTGAAILGGVASADKSGGTFVFGASAPAPVFCYQLNLAGVNGSALENLSAGSGVITYSATTPMYVDDSQPPGSSSEGVFTAENTDCVYAQLPVNPSETFVQPFNVQTSA